MKRISFVYPYYENPEMLAQQYRVWSGYPAELKARVDIVLVDDGSPTAPANAVRRPSGLPPLSLYRVLVDKPWNQHGARNLGADKAAGPWLFLSDMDHVLRADDLARLMQRKNRGKAYMFHRLDAPALTPTRRPDGSEKPHPNSFAMTRDLYWSVGGYDEDYCGIYGTDGLFRARLRAAARIQHLPDVALVRYPREVVADASTRGLPRKDGRAEGAKQAVAARKAREGRADQIAILQFPWERLL